MGALPKNKITRAERGKRRSGNTPKLKKDLNVTSVQKSKKNFVEKMLEFSGFTK